MDESLPLSALLSQAWVAFAIEFDNEFEHLTPHRTTNHGVTGDPKSSPWLVSMVMWLQLMQFVPDEGIGTKELYRRTDLEPKAFRMWLIRMSKWWSYLRVSENFVRPTPGGRKALEAWRPLTAQIQKRWQKRFGKAWLDQLLEVMETMVRHNGAEYPDYLPVLGYELLSYIPSAKGRPRSVDGLRSGEALPALFSKLLLTFATEFERDSKLSLAVCANLLRLADDDGVPILDLPRLSGVSKEAIAMAVRRAEECGLGTVQRGAGSGRLKIFALNSKGRLARKEYYELTGQVEAGWANQFGKAKVEKLRELLEGIAGASASGSSRLLEGLKPYPEGWRASVPACERLPHFPMVLHRGGFPDGS
jgi:DNA-binding MarR family transcriptional regulator